MARFDGGWVKLLRRVRSGPIGNRQGNSCLGLWSRILLMVNREESEVEWGDGMRKVLPGEIVTSLPELANSGRPVDIAQTRRDLAFLEKRQTIQQTVSKRGRIISVCNWDKYHSTSEYVELPAADVSAGSQQDSGRIAAGCRTLNGEERSREEKKERKNTARSAARATYSPIFEGLWDLFGKVGKKADASKAFEDKRFSEEEIQELRLAIPAYLADCSRCDRKVMYFGTFLRDDYRPWLEARPAGNGSGYVGIAAILGQEGSA